MARHRRKWAVVMWSPWGSHDVISYHRSKNLAQKKAKRINKDARGTGYKYTVKMRRRFRFTRRKKQK